MFKEVGTQGALDSMMGDRSENAGWGHIEKNFEFRLRTYDVFLSITGSNTRF